MGDGSVGELLARFRAVAGRVEKVTLTSRFGIPANSVYRYLKPDYTPTRSMDPGAKSRLRKAVETLERELAVSPDVPRGTPPSGGVDLPERLGLPTEVLEGFSREWAHMEAEQQLVGLGRTLRVEALSAMLRSYALARAAEVAGLAERASAERARAAAAAEEASLARIRQAGGTPGPPDEGEQVMPLLDEEEEAGAAAGKRRAGRKPA
jgi:hypothetical protein